MARPARTDQRRHEIVHSAAKLIDDVGYAHVTMDDIAAAAGMRKSTLYHYIDRKHDLLYLINGEFLNQLLEWHEERLRMGLDPSHLLLEIMADMLNLMHQHRGHARVFFEHLQDLTSTQRREVEELRGRYYRQVIEVIEAGVEAGDFFTPDPHLTALGLFGMCSWSYTWYEPEGRLSSRAVANHFWQIVMNGLTSPTGGVDDRRDG